jgi:hypothetical protein
LGIEILPAFVIDRDLHLRRITVVHVLAAAIVILSVIILRIIDIRIVIHPVPILRTVVMPPLPAISLLGLGFVGTQFDHRKHDKGKQ